jgi:predicted ABC-type transport system involved in lysophospholipase L1 biosynthesis ATPase subunit
MLRSDNEPELPSLPTPLMRLDGVSRIFDGGTVVALREVTVQIEPGECLAILGPSGSGKSSIVNMLSGIDRPSTGRVCWKGEPVSSRRRWAELRASPIGVVFQEFHLLPTLTAIENVELALFGHSHSASERKFRAQAALERVGLGARHSHQPHALSGGERQRVAIARSIVNEPQLLLADEPTGNLDSANAKMVADLLLSLNRLNGMALVLVTHDEGLATRCSRCIRVKDGTIVEERTAAHMQKRKRRR